MSSSQLVLHRYTELLDAGQLDAAFNYLSDDIIYVTWLGVVEGRENVIAFLRDNVRFLHHARNFNRWRRVQHCLDTDLVQHLDRISGDNTFFNEDGYDSHGYATFERDGTISRHLKVSLQRVHVKETIVVKDTKVVLVTVMQQL